MIAKLSYGRSIYGAIIYNHDKLVRQEARLLGGNRMTHPRSDKNIDIRTAILHSFYPYLNDNVRTQKPVIHISLNPAVEDELSDREYAMLAGTYMEKMGYGNQPYVVYFHEDIDRRHLHIVSLTVDETGKKISNSNDRYKNRDVCRELEQEFGLVRVSNQTGKEHVYPARKIDYRKGNIKNQLSNVLITVIPAYHFQTMGEFNALLSCYNIQSNHIKGTDDEHLFNGITYAPTDTNGVVKGKPVKSSRIGKIAGYNYLMSKMKKSAEYLKKEKPHLAARNFLRSAMKHSMNRAEFRKQLLKHNMDVIFRINHNHRITGVTFVDHHRKLVYNGSRLGKEFSANQFERLFNETPPPPIQSTAIPRESNNETITEHPFFVMEDLMYVPLHGEDLEYAARKSKRRHRRKR